MKNAENIEKLITEIHKLLASMEIPKKKDAWEKLSAVTGFVGTVVIALLSLIYTKSYERLQSDRLQQFNEAQIATQRAQTRIEELKAITSLVPLLSSKDPGTRGVVQQMLQAVKGSRTNDLGVAGPTSPPPTVGTGLLPTPMAPVRAPTSPLPPNPTSLLDEFARIALAPSETHAKRVEATREIAKIAEAPETPLAVKQKATEVATRIAASPDAPAMARSLAEEVVARLRSVSPSQIAAIVAKETVRRKITDVILHHTGIATDKYGPNFFPSLTKHMIESRGWRNTSWHYAIAPDGYIWIGSKIDEKVWHTPGMDAKSVSVLIAFDGQTELPTEKQRVALSALLRALLDRFGLKPEENFSEHRGFHSDYRRPGHPVKSCPGPMLTKKLVLEWIKG
jgi:hypothetical protein